MYHITLHNGVHLFSRTHIHAQRQILAGQLPELQLLLIPCISLNGSTPTQVKVVPATNTVRSSSSLTQGPSLGCGLLPLHIVELLIVLAVCWHYFQDRLVLRLLVLSLLVVQYVDLGLELEHCWWTRRLWYQHSFCRFLVYLDQQHIYCRAHNQSCFIDKANATSCQNKSKSMLPLFLIVVNIGYRPINLLSLDHLAC